MLYGSQTWATRKEDIKRLEAFKYEYGEDWKKSVGLSIITN